MTHAQKIARDRHGLTAHSKRSGAVICHPSDGWAIIWPNGSVDFHLPSLAVARAEIDCN